METRALLSAPAACSSWLREVLAWVLRLEAVVMGVGETDAFPAAGSVVLGIYRDLNACLCTNLMLYISHTCKFISN